jgi:predicted nucleotidyltransferase
LAPALNILRLELPALAGVYIFCSVATDTAKPGSDIDLAVFAGRPIAPEVLHETREKIAQAMLREIDLVDLAGADTILQMQVIHEGKLLVAPNPMSVGLFELRILRDYRDLKRRRDGIEADIARRGRVHA